MSEYEGCEIRNIKRGSGERGICIYAQLYSSDGRLLISATLDYIVMQLANRLPRESSRTHAHTDTPPDTQEVVR